MQVLSAKLLLFLALGLVSAEALPRVAKPDPGRSLVRTVVIDPGHGGKDPGAIASGVKEKDVTLEIAMMLRDKIRKDHPEVNVILTRDKDVAVDLIERTRIANRNEADLFISIHCNAMPAGNGHIFGSETYVLGLHRAEENLAVARRENAAILLEDNYKVNYGNFDPNSNEAYILMNLYQGAYLEKSIDFARRVEEEHLRHAGRKSKGVKQAGFLVLRENAMPSVLVEAGYLTNAKEAEFLASRQGQEKMAESLARAFARYREAVEGPSSVKGSNGTPADVKEPKKVDGYPENVWYAVQVTALKAPLAPDHPLRKKVPALMEKKEAGLLKYMSGPYVTKEEAESVRKKMAQTGIKDIFVVTYKGEQRMP